MGRCCLKLELTGLAILAGQQASGFSFHSESCCLISAYEALEAMDTIPLLIDSNYVSNCCYSAVLDNLNDVIMLM